MSRPKTCRCVRGIPNAFCFKPRGIPRSDLEEQILSPEEFEAIRLADFEGLNCTEAAESMQISRHTFGRILASAHKIVADVLVHGKALTICGFQKKPEKEEPDNSFCLRDNAHHRSILDTEMKQVQISDESLEIKNRLHTLLTFYKSKKGDKKMPIIAISSVEPGLHSDVDPRFGRAAGFVIYNTETEDISYLDNGASQVMPSGAGIETAQRISEAGVQVVLSGYVGPKAFEALQEAEIKVCQNMDGMSVAKAIDRFLGGSVDYAKSPNKEN